MRFRKRSPQGSSFLFLEISVVNRYFDSFRAILRQFMKFLLNLNGSRRRNSAFVFGLIHTRTAVAIFFTKTTGQWSLFVKATSKEIR